MPVLNSKATRVGQAGIGDGSSAITLRHKGNYVFCTCIWEGQVLAGIAKTRTDSGNTRKRDSRLVNNISSTEVYPDDTFPDTLIRNSQQIVEPWCKTHPGPDTLSPDTNLKLPSILALSLHICLPTYSCDEPGKRIAHEYSLQCCTITAVRNRAGRYTCPPYRACR